MTSSGSPIHRKSFTDLLVHVHPAKVPEDTLRPGLSWGLGGMCVTLLFLLFVTGTLQLLSYEPAISGAYDSVRAMYTRVPFGGWIRNIHYWSANLLVVGVLLHLLRVFLTGAIGPGRRSNWTVGLVLLLLVYAANFSGYLLPWDQLAYWAVTICTSMMGYFPGIGSWLMELFRGGTEVGSATLARFFALHVTFIPGCLVLFSCWHFWLVRKSGGLVGKEQEEGGKPVRRVPAVPHLVVREAAVGLSLIALVLVVSVFLDAPLQEQANPGMSPNPAKAPWYFLGFQELLLHLHPVFAICVVPVLTALLLFLLPFWQESCLPPGIWFGGRRGRRLAIWAFGSGIVSTFLLLIADEKLLRIHGGLEELNGIVIRGYLPLSVAVCLLVGGYQLLVRKWKYLRSEAVMAAMLFCCAIFFVLTLSGCWFRGPNMQLLLLGL